MNYKYKEIGKRIASERKNIKMSQEKLAADLHISRNTLSAIENGNHYSFDFELLANLASTFGCEIGYLLCEPNYEHRTGRTTDIVTETGLSAAAVDTILSLSQQNISALTVIIENPDFSKLLHQFNTLLHYEKVNTDIYADITKAHFKAELSGETDILFNPYDALSYKVTKTFSNIIEEETNKGE